MKKHIHFQSVLSGVFAALLFVITSTQGWALEPSDPPPARRLLITEIQTGTYGSGHAGDEFIELYNYGNQPLDLTGWEIRIVLAASGTLASPSAKLALDPPVDEEGEIRLLAPGASYVIHTPSVAVSSDILGQTVDSFLSSTDKSVVLLEPDLVTCEFVVRDAVAWGNAMEGEGTAIPVNSSKEKVVQRRTDVDGVYSDTHDNSRDFSLTTLENATTANPRSPGVVNTIRGVRSEEISLAPAEIRIEHKECTLPEAELPDVGLTNPSASPPSRQESTAGDVSTAKDPVPVLPAHNLGLQMPQVSEILPNPASPQTDAADEFIELYNPNDSYFDLSGFMFEVGATTTKRYIFPAGTQLPARSFVAFFSADTKLSLSNTQGRVKLLDPFARTLTQSDMYSTAKDGQAWILAEGKWQWTTTPTPHAVNAIAAPAAKKATTTKKTSQPSTATGSTSNANTGTDTVAVTASSGPDNKPSFSPLHPGVLALVGFFALLYGAYEYRHDMANKFHQFRSYRAARREHRQGVEGR